ncbi:MAG: thioredoxin family protein [Acidobacteriota bacterium]
MFKCPYRQLFVLLLLGLAISWPAAAEVDSVFSAFRPNGDYLFELDGEAVSDATLYFSDRARAYLIVGPALGSPLLIHPRSGVVEKISLMKVQKNEDGSIDLLADASFDQVGKFRLDGLSLLFDYKGQQAVVRPKPALVGMQSATALRDFKPEYAAEADAYAPSSAALQALAGQGRDVTVRVFLGTWCPVCGRTVPKVIKTEEALAGLGGSNIQFEYYGLPRNISEDPVAAEMKINGVPTVVVLTGEREIGRIDGRDLHSPETALRELLDS